MILLTPEEISNCYNIPVNRFPREITIENWAKARRSIDEKVAKAQLKKVHHKIEAMVAGGYSLDEILQSMFKEIE